MFSSFAFLCSKVSSTALIIAPPIRKNMQSIEESVGISEFATAGLAGFSGILKHRCRLSPRSKCTVDSHGLLPLWPLLMHNRRYRDFQVNEVDQHGQVVRLESLEASPSQV